MAVPFSIHDSKAEENLHSRSNEKEQLQDAHAEYNATSESETSPQRSQPSRFTVAEEEAVIRKLDWHIMPLIFVVYSISILDRSNLGNAKIAGMQDDIDISGNRYAWLGTIFYISCEQYIPCNFDAT